MVAINSLEQSSALFKHCKFSVACSQSLLAQVLGSWDAAHCTTEPSITRSHCSPANPAVFSATFLHSALSAETDCHEMCVWFQHPCTPWAPTGTQQLSVGALEMLQAGTCSAPNLYLPSCVPLQGLELPPAAMPGFFLHQG